MLLVTVVVPPALLASGLQFNEQKDRVRITLGGQSIVDFVFRDDKILRPYFANARLADGRQVTRNHPPVPGADAVDHDTMHPGIWLGLGDINGQDFWRNKAAMEHVRFVVAPHVHEGKLRFATECRLKTSSGEPLCGLINHFTIAERSGGWLLVWRATFVADTQAIVFGDQEEMGFGARVATAFTEKKDGLIVSSSGKKSAKDTWGQPAAWCDYSGTDGRSGGILLMAGDKNFRESWWHNRDYGVFVSNPFGRAAMKQGPLSAIEVARGATLSLTFGALIHDEQEFDRAAEWAAFRQMAAEPKILQPRPYQVLQRHGFNPRVAPVNEVEGKARGGADVKLVWTASAQATDGWQARTVPQENAYGGAVAWTPLQVTMVDDKLSSSLRVPAGGWYRLEVKRGSDEPLVVEPFGVGEVFVVAGQSYAVGANDENLKVEEPGRRVVTLNWREDRWQVADDPIPHAGPKGSLWPALGDILVPLLRTPVGFVNAAVGGTSTRQWATDGKLYADLVTAGKEAGDFRAVLWQQGESDVIEKTPRAEYVTRVKVIRESAMKAWAIEVPWLPAKSTLHPTVYRAPEQEEAIRAAIGDLWKQPGFRPGPDTDVLDAENRGGPMTMRHFSGIGQRRAAQLWFAAIWSELHRVE